MGGAGVGVAQALRLLKNREANAAITVQKLWRKAIAKMLATRLRRCVDGRVPPPHDKSPEINQCGRGGTFRVDGGDNQR